MATGETTTETAAVATTTTTGDDQKSLSMEPGKDAILVDQLRETLEEVFTLSNLESDKLLRSSMNSQGFIPLQYVLTFPAIAQTIQSLLPPSDTNNKSIQLSLLKRGIEASRHLKFEVEDINNATMVRYVHSVERKTLIIRELSKNVTKKHILSLFNDEPHSSNLAKVSSIKLDIGNNWFVNFGSEKECLESFKYLTDNNIKILGETLHVRVKSSASTHPLVGHGHGLPVESSQSSMTRNNIPIESQQLGMSDYAQHAQSPILHHTGMTPYGAVAYEQHQYDQMYKTGTTPPPLPETRAMYDAARAINQVQQLTQQQQVAIANQAQQVQQAQLAQQMAIRQQQLINQKAAQQHQQQHQQGVGVPRAPPGQMSPQHMAIPSQRPYDPVLPPGQLVDDFVEQDRREPGGPGGVVGGPPPMQSPPQSRPDNGPGSRGPGGGSGQHGIKSHYHRQPRCDYPTDNYLKYNQKDFLDVFKKLQDNEELDIPHSMAGRDRRIVSEEVREPASLLSPADIARETRDRDRNQRRGDRRGGYDRRGGQRNRRRYDMDDNDDHRDREHHDDDESYSDDRDDYGEVDDHDNDHDNGEYLTNDDDDHDDDDHSDEDDIRDYYDNRRNDGYNDNGYDDRRPYYDDGDGRRGYEYGYRDDGGYEGRGNRNRGGGGGYGYDYEQNRYYNDGYGNNNDRYYNGYDNEYYYDDGNNNNNDNRNGRRSGRRRRSNNGVNNNNNNGNVNQNRNNKGRGRAQKSQKGQKGQKNNNNNNNQQQRRRNNNNNRNGQGVYYQKKGANKEANKTKEVDRNASMKNASNNKLYKRKETEEEKRQRKELERAEKERKELERKEKAAKKARANQNKGGGNRKQQGKGRFVYKPKQSKKETTVE